MKNQENKGFVLIMFLITLAIIVIWAGFYFSKSGGQKSVIETGNNAIRQTKENNTIINNQQIEIQNNLNSIGN